MGRKERGGGGWVGKRGEEEVVEKRREDREGGKGEEEKMQERRRDGEEGVEREEREAEVERRVKKRG